MKKNILIVEDEAILMRSLTEEFRGAGFGVLQAFDGKEGLKVALEKKPDLILLDIIMPVMDGMTMLKEMRQDEWGSEVPVILLTNLNDNEKIAEAIEGGTFDYLIKSDFELKDIVNKVKQNLGIK